MSKDVTTRKESQVNICFLRDFHPRIRKRKNGIQEGIRFGIAGERMMLNQHNPNSGSVTETVPQRRVGNQELKLWRRENNTVASLISGPLFPSP